MLLWAILTFMVALAVSGLTLTLVRRRDANRSNATATSILAAQLADVDSQLAAGALSTTEAAPLKNEIRRRVLAESREAEAMGRQTDPHFRGEDPGNEVVYGDVGDNVENEDQTDAHHAEDDEHL